VRKRFFILVCQYGVEHAFDGFGIHTLKMMFRFLFVECFLALSVVDHLLELCNRRVDHYEPVIVLFDDFECVAAYQRCFASCRR